MDDEKQRLVDEVSKALVDKGKLIEAGWLSLRIMAIPEDAPEIQLTEMRGAFFAGAQHLWGSLFSVLDSSNEPTPADEQRFNLIDNELKGFCAEFNERVRANEN